MAIRRGRRSKSLCEKCAELAIAVPQVVAHRVRRAALANPAMSQGDRREFQRMVSEKQVAFAEAYWQMALQMYRLNQQFAGIAIRAFWAPHSLNASWAASAAIQAHTAAMTVLDKGLAPMHRTAVSNAKRLSKASLR